MMVLLRDLVQCSSQAIPMRKLLALTPSGRAESSVTANHNALWLPEVLMDERRHLLERLLGGG